MNSEVRSWTTEKLVRAVGIAAILSAAGIAAAHAGPPVKTSLTFSVTDPVGDEKGTIDVTGMTMTWNPATGKYQIQLTADAAHPFTGQFRITINVFNPASSSAQKLFSLTCTQCQKFGNANKTDFNLGSASTTSLTLSGGDKELSLWSAGDAVATNSYAGLGNPSGVSLFRSSVDTQPVPGTYLTDEDLIGADDTTESGSGWYGTNGLATIATAP